MKHNLGLRELANLRWTLLESVDKEFGLKKRKEAEEEWESLTVNVI